MPDIVRASVFSVLPALPPIFFGMWIGAKTPTQREATTVLEKASNFFSSLPDKLIQISIIGASLLFLLLGMSPQFGVTATYLVTLVALGRVIILPALTALGAEATILIWIILVMAAIFAGSGSRDAYKFRSGEWDTFPRYHSSLPNSEFIADKPLYMLRKFSSGSFVGTTGLSRIWFVSTNEEETITFELDSEPHKGFLCYTLDWCSLSGWTFSSQTKGKNKQD